MIYSLTWLPAVLEEAELKVAPVKGWASRGRGPMGTVVGVICHHTAGPLRGNMPSLGTLIEGRSDLPGPLAQLGLGRDGTFYVIAAGRCNHAGKGSWQGFTAGNSSFIGIEAENAGTQDDMAWPAIQMECYQRGVAAILTHLGRGVEFCAGHKEYALPQGRKNDPLFNMAEFRGAVGSIMSGAPPDRVLIPAFEPPAIPARPVGRPTLRRGAVGDLVGQVQRKCNAPVSNHFDSITEAAIREFQRPRSLVPDGIVGPKTWQALDAAGPP
jgi:peptidoglycan hydrolase-like protein with peptidoglycan-binding domain